MASHNVQAVRRRRHAWRGRGNERTALPTVEGGNYWRIGETQPARMGETRPIRGSSSARSLFSASTITVSNFRQMKVIEPPRSVPCWHRRGRWKRERATPSSVFAISSACCTQNAVAFRSDTRCPWAFPWKRPFS